MATVPIIIFHTIFGASHSLNKKCKDDFFIPFETLSKTPVVTQSKYYVHEFLM